MLFGDSISKTCLKCKRYERSQKSFIEASGGGRSEILIVGPPAESENLEYISEKRVVITYEIPLSEIVFDFFDQLKSKSRTKSY